VKLLLVFFGNIFCIQVKAQNILANVIATQQQSIGNTTINTFTNSAFDNANVANRLKRIQCIPNTCIFVLPLQLIEFSGIKKTDGNELIWKTKDAVDLQHFELERSIDAFYFSKVHTTSAVNTYIEQQYHFLDQNYVIGKNYYRLKSIDISGKSVYSKVIMLDNSLHSAIAFPNPAKEKVTLQFAAPIPVSTYFVIYNTESKIMLQTSKHIISGIKTVSFNIQNWPAAVYFIRMITKEQNSDRVFRVVKSQ
jgi:hypothetical protein